MNSLEGLKGKICVITGGGGVIGASLAEGLGNAGIITIILDINEEAAIKVATQVKKETGSDSYGLKTNVLDKKSLQDMSHFVTGICIPVDGGYSAFGGV